MNKLKAVTYIESREAFFAKKLRKSERGLDNLLKYGTDPDALAESGEEVSFYRDALAALREQAEREKVKQWLDDMDNPLEPLKIEAALRSETMKMEYRKKNKPEIVSALDYTIIAVLSEALERGLEGKQDG